MIDITIVASQCNFRLWLFERTYAWWYHLTLVSMRWPMFGSIPLGAIKRTMLLSLFYWTSS
jgi:hypothetical protein